MLSAEPRRDMPYVLIAEPQREYARMLSMEPMCTKLSTDLEKHGERVENTTWRVKTHFLTLYRR